MRHPCSSFMRFIAFYLPQYYPVPENDHWWGVGFTEWFNVAKARPLFRGHYQPHIPADLGFYDLRVPETREAQADMARAHGIEGFCYWHYWFAGKRLLERPFQEVLASGKPNFPFCLAWANESWTSVWVGNERQMIIEQTYPGKEDYLNHFRFLANAFQDDRYITVDGKPIFMVYYPKKLPNSVEFTDIFRECAHQFGFKGLHLVAMNVDPKRDLSKYGFDAITHSNFYDYAFQGNRLKRMVMKFYRNTVHAKIPQRFRRPKFMLDYVKALQFSLLRKRFEYDYYPCVFPNWDNTPRFQYNGSVLNGSTPENFRTHVLDAMSLINPMPEERRIIFIKSWNEWAEGNHLEPDQKYGTQYLEVIKEVQEWHVSKNDKIVVCQNMLVFGKTFGIFA